ncbi:MAG: BON domain-containing protein [Dysgonomonas sp.]
MKKVIFIYACIAMLGLGLYSCGPSDTKLQKNVTTALSIAQPNVTVAVKDGVVTLSGKVDSQSAKDAAEQVSKGVKGIKSVVNNIEVTQPPVTINPDSTLTTLITTALTTAGYKDVVATVKDGEVTLTGNVKQADLTKVMQIANEAKPKKVINQLIIKK